MATALNVASYTAAGARTPTSIMIVLHVAVMLLVLTLFARLVYERLLSGLRRAVVQASDPLPKSLVWLTVGALVYVLTLMAITAATYGEGAAEIRNGQEVWVVGNLVKRTLEPGSVAAFQARTLSIFSSGWMFFSLLTVLLWQRVEHQIDQLRTARKPLIRPHNADGINS